MGLPLSQFAESPETHGFEYLNRSMKGS